VQLNIARIYGLSSLLLALVPAIAAAGPLPPGATIDIDTFEEPFTLPAGPILGQKTIFFTLQYDLPAGATSADPVPATSGKLDSTVFRNTTTGGLTFVYDVDVQNETDYVDEVSRLIVGSFEDVSVDVRGENPTTTRFRAERSTQGALITTETGEGLGSAPVLLVDTDATAFNEQGFAQYLALAEFVVSSPGDTDGPVQTVLNTRVNLNGLLQPAGDAGPGPGPTPVPLPPAAWAALATAGVFGAGSRLRRRCGRA